MLLIWWHWCLYAMWSSVNVEFNHFCSRFLFNYLAFDYYQRAHCRAVKVRIDMGHGYPKWQQPYLGKGFINWKSALLFRNWNPSGKRALPIITWKKSNTAPQKPDDLTQSPVRSISVECSLWYSIRISQLQSYVDMENLNLWITQQAQQNILFGSEWCGKQDQWTIKKQPGCINLTKIIVQPADKL